MKKIITYDELPYSKGQSIYLRMETDPVLYTKLMFKGYKIVNHLRDVKESTIFVTGSRQAYGCSNLVEYKKQVDQQITEDLSEKKISRPKTLPFSYQDLISYRYKIPFVLKNENQNGGREKFLIKTEEDYDNLVKTIQILFDKELLLLRNKDDIKHRIDYLKYLTNNFTVQEYIKTPSRFNTTVRLLTTPSDDLLYASLKYNRPEEYKDDTTLLGYFLNEVFPLSTKSIVSNTLSGGDNIILGEDNYYSGEKELLKAHNIESDTFHELVDTTKQVHRKNKVELGIISGFDYIYDKDKEKWFLLEYHSRPMVKDYSKRQGLRYKTEEDKITAEGRVRATALSLVLKKTR